MSPPSWGFLLGTKMQQLETEQLIRLGTGRAESFYSSPIQAAATVRPLKITSNSAIALNRVFMVFLSDWA